MFLPKCKGVFTLKVKQNIGIVDALLRITCGLTILAWSTSKMVKKPWRESYLILSVIGAMKVGEGIVRFCPIVALFEQMPVKSNEESKTNLQIEPYNPS